MRKTPARTTLPEKKYVALARDFYIPKIGYEVDGWGTIFGRAHAGFSICHVIQFYSPAHAPSSCVPGARSPIRLHSRMFN